MTKPSRRRKWYVVTVGKGELPKGTIVGEMYGETEQEAREMLDFHLQGRCLDMFELMDAETQKPKGGGNEF